MHRIFRRVDRLGLGGEGRDLVFVSLALQWARDRRLSGFLADVERRVRIDSDEERRTRALTCLAWAHEQMRRQDPVTAFVHGAWPEAALPPAAAMPWNWS